MTDRFIINPLTRILPNINSSVGFMLENLESKKSFEISSHVLKILNYCTRERTVKEIKEFGRNYLGKQEAELIKLLVNLIKSGILITKTNYKKRIKEYSDWFKYDWLVPLHFLLSTEEVDVADKKDSNKQRDILLKYLNDTPPKFYKSYNRNKNIILPKHKIIEDMSLLGVLMKRRTSRSFGPEGLSLQELGTILYYGCQELKELRELQSKNYERHPRILLRSLFSPFEIYIVVNNVSGIDKGIYHYNVVKHSLELLKIGDFKRDIGEIAQGQTFFAEGSIVLLISAIFKRYMFRYRQPRAYRELLASTSELAHYLILYATAVGVKTAETPALKDSELASLLGLNPWNEEVLYLLTFGK